MSMLDARSCGLWLGKSGRCLRAGDQRRAWGAVGELVKMNHGLTDEAGR